VAYLPAPALYHALGELLDERGLAMTVGDEGGFAPHLAGNVQAMEVILEAIDRAGHRPGEQVPLAVDPPAMRRRDASSASTPASRRPSAVLQ
jgi:enolase